MRFNCFCRVFLLLFLVHTISSISIDAQIYFQLSLRTASAFFKQFFRRQKWPRPQSKIIRRANLPSNRKQNEMSYLRMRKTDILHRPRFNISKEMETYVAISLFICLSEVSVDFFGCLKVIYFAIQCSCMGKVFCSFSGAVNMVKFGYSHLTSLKAVIKYLSESTTFEFIHRASKH